MKDTNMWQIVRFCVLLLLPPLISSSGSNNASDVPVIQIEAVSSTLLGVDNEFMFRCNASSANYTISLIIDGEINSVKMDRVTNSTDKKQKNTIDFTFSHTTVFDNGTTFMCGATNEASPNVTTNFSDILTLQIQYAPRFMEGNNVTILAELPVDKTNKLLCSILMSNPPVDNITFTNTSSHFTNIETEITKTSNTTKGVITFNKAKVENRGIFTCTATNEMGSTTLSYETFIGGPPNNISVEPKIKISNGSLVITLEIDDMSDAPALSLYLLLEDVVIPRVIFLQDKNLSIPVRRQSLKEVYDSVDNIEAGNYTLIIQAYNLLGNLTIVNETTFVPGLSVDVFIEAPSNVTQGHNFTFNCKAENNATFTVLVNGNQTMNRIVPGKMTATSQEFTFINMTYKDNGIPIQCLANDRFKSQIAYVDVLYPPMIKFAGSTIEAFLNTREVINVTINANPTNYITQWMKDGKEIKTGDNYEADKDYLVIKNVSMDDEANYTVKVTNDLGSATESFEISVYDGPFFKEGSPNSTVLTEIKTGSTVNMTCTIKKSVPPVTELRIEPSKGTNWRTVHDGLSSVTLTIDKASSNNTRKFTCVAVNNVTTSTLAFNNYVGGVPNKMKVEVMKKEKDSTVKLTFNVTDNSDAPATGLLVYLKDTMKKNKTLNITNAPQTNFVFTDALESSYDDLGAGMHIVNIYGVNLIGPVHLMDYNFSTPSNKPTVKAHKHTLSIALGVSLPLGLLILCLVICGVVYYYYQKRRRSGYSSLDSGTVQHNDTD